MNRHHVRYMLALAFAGLMLGGSAGAFAQDANSGDKTAATQNNKAGKQSNSAALRVWDEGYQAMRAVHAARLAIFDGVPDQATQLIQQASDSLDAADKDEQLVKDKQDLIAIDGSLALADTFVPSPKKAEHIAKANEHFKKGEQAKGVEQLRLGEIEVGFSRVMMPLTATEKRLSHALDLAKQQKYYEANLALKAAEEGLTIDTVSLVDFPESNGDQSNTSQNNTTATSDSAQQGDSKK